MEYTGILVHVPSRAHEKLHQAITLSRPISVKLDLLGSPDHKLFVTPLQRKKIEQAIAAGRKEMPLRFTTKQAKYSYPVSLRDYLLVRQSLKWKAMECFWGNVITHTNYVILEKDS